MMIKRLVILQSVLALGLGSVFFVPKDIRMQPSAIGLSLPESVGDWQGTEQPIGQGRARYFRTGHAILPKAIHQRGG